MAASVYQPVVVPGHYNPMFKVDVMLHAPLREHLGSLADLRVDLMMLSMQLDTLCKQELTSQPSHKIDHGKTSSSFNDKANVVYSNLQQTLSKSHNSSCVEAYLSESGLDHLFPRAAAYVTRPDSFSLVLKKTYIDDYLKQLSHLHHILSLSRQINHDVTYQERPKYLAHQMAVLYQAIHSLPAGGNTLARHKANIEENFKALKTAIAEISEDERQPLFIEIRNWVLELTDNIIQVISSMPVSMTEELLPVAQVLQR